MATRALSMKPTVTVTRGTIVTLTARTGCLSSTALTVPLFTHPMDADRRWSAPSCPPPAPPPPPACCSPCRCGSRRTSSSMTWTQSRPRTSQPSRAARGNVRSHRRRRRTPSTRFSPKSDASRAGELEVPSTTPDLQTKTKR